MAVSTLYSLRAPFRLRATVLLTALALAGCAVGPDYQPPRAQTPTAFKDVQTPTEASSKALAASPDPAWWRNFRDPQLDSLIARAINGNLTLQQTVLRIAGAREQVTQAQGAFFPSVNANASVNRQQLGLEGILKAHDVRGQLEENEPGSGEILDSATQPVTLFQGGFDASWELDLFGKTRRSVEAADAQRQASIERRNDALVSLEAEVARTYLQLRGAQSVLQTLQTQIDIAQQTVELTQSQAQNGLAPQQDVENAGAQLTSLQSQLPTYQSQTQQAMNALAVLVGQPPGALDRELQATKALPAIPAVVAVGVPAELARRRPDVRQAEASLHAATAEIGVSVAQLFPSLSLTGQIGMRNTDTDYLTDWSSHFYAYGPQISLPIFQGGQLVSSVRLARAQQASAALEYRQTVLTALQDVENALVSYRTDQDRTERLERTASSLQNAYDLSRESYRQGITTFINVLDAQRQLAQARQQATEAHVRTSTDLVALYKALGGGWQPYQSINPTQYSVFGPAVTVP
ncbi:efflux transporter outer membrane subunit [Nissabacter sp. SGAir0207]|uniref:efflux transporter outer membrane subunit n=1 Tax=Nissabacter sp. SGAir0207 TaxID=2126321 RepID=UPI0010CD4683|nr:efflux transporter outer membrane subunit [Nissabacter sp. SGAir0207]QCR35640.1 RND transporter [Nissabacter sp. SGAir0207]